METSGLAGCAVLREKEGIAYRPGRSPHHAYLQATGSPFHASAARPPKLTCEYLTLHLPAIVTVTQLHGKYRDQLIFHPPAKKKRIEISGLQA